MSALTILSDCGNFKAVVRPNDNGACAVFYGNLRGWRKLGIHLYRLPFHAALDEAHDAVMRLRRFPLLE